MLLDCKGPKDACTVWDCVTRIEKQAVVISEIQQLSCQPRTGYAASQQPGIRQSIGDRQGDEQGGHQSKHAAGVEIQNIDSAGALMLGQHERGDQVPAQEEEDRDPKAAWHESLKARVAQHNNQHRNSPNSIQGRNDLKSVGAHVALTHGHFMRAESVIAARRDRCPTSEI